MRATQDWGEAGLRKGGDCGKMKQMENSGASQMKWSENI